MSRRSHTLPLPFSLLVSVTIAVFLAIVGAAQAQGLVAVYGFNEGSGTAVADVSGNSNHGTVSGATWTTAGRFGSALVFNGANAVVTIPNSASLRLTTGMTLEAWVYPTSAPTGWRAVVDKNVDGYYLMASTDQGNRPGVGGTFTAGNQNTFAPSELAVNTWAHLAATFDGATVRLYVNGAQVASRAQTTPLAATTGTLQIGGDSYPDEFFAGRIDEVRVYNRALTQAEIQADMNTAVGSGTPNTAPTITAIANQVTNEDAPTSAIGFTVGDAQTAAGSLTLSGSSNNTTLVPNGNIVFGGSGASRSVTVTPAANRNGMATITVTVSDGQLSTPTSFQLTVNTVNDAPTITSMANQTTTSGTAVGPITFTVGDAETAAGSLMVNGSSSNPTLVPNGNIVFGGTGANRTVTVTPAAGQTGNASITVTVSDGPSNTPTSFQLTVNATPSGGLVAVYGFNEGSGTAVADVSGNSNHGTVSGATWTTAGRFGSALVFNGANAVVTIPNSASLRLTTGMTLEAWVYPTSAPTGWRAVVDKNVDGYYLMASTDQGNRPGVGGTFTAGNQNTFAPSELAVNTWAHLAATFDGATVRLYVNGAQVASRAQTTPLAATTGTLQIGGDSYPDEFFAGRIDEVRVYNRALTQAEIQADMNTAVGGGTPPPSDTTPPTVAINAPVAGASVFGLVSVSANASDNVGVVGVQFFVDGQLLGAETLNSPFSVVWDTVGSSGNHVLTAVARDASNNTATITPVSVTVFAGTPDRVGQWGAPFSWPIVAVNAILLPTGEVLAYDGQSFAGKNARVWNPTTNAFTSVNIATGTNIFCSGNCHLPDGRVLVTGGHTGPAHVGVTDANVFNPTTRQWTRVASMHTPRWYPTNTTLPDGRILVTAGEINCDGCNALIPEIYSAITNTWTELPAASLDISYYPHMFVLPDGRVLAASSAETAIVTQTLDISAQTWSVIDTNAVDGGSAAMYLPGKILKSGTSTNPDDPAVPSAETAYILDMTQPLPKWREISPMVFPRTYHTLTNLPDGKVLATGGGPTTDALGVNDAIKAAELWSPDTETWETMASMQRPRLYHSTAILLTDARVLVMGGGRFDNQAAPTDQLSGEIYSPPYLFKGPRPVITSAPVQIGYGQVITVQTPDASRIGKVSMIKLGAVTHAFDMDQRYVPLTFTTGSQSLSVQTPANANFAPPGHYMLFIVDTMGVPSVAVTLNIQ